MSSLQSKEIIPNIKNNSTTVQHSDNTFNYGLFSNNNKNNIIGTNLNYIILYF